MTVIFFPIEHHDVIKNDIVFIECGLRFEEVYELQILIDSLIEPVQGAIST